MSTINFDQLTMAEVEQIEDMTGKRMDQLMVVGEVPPASAIKAFTLVMLRRTNPAATTDDVGAMTYLACIELLSSDEPEETADPKAVNGDATVTNGLSSRQLSPSSTDGLTPTSVG